MPHKILPLLFLIIILQSCNRHEDPVTSEPIILNSKITHDFESGSIGKVNHIRDTEWELHLADDNGNSSLPEKWRNWWYVKMSTLPTDENVQITLKNRAWTYYYLPVYSYNQKDWHHFDEDEVLHDSNNDLVISKQFAEETVWIARFVPYTFSDLEQYTKTIETNSSVTVETPGLTRGGKPIYLWKITDNSTPLETKERVLIHARTHPAEIPSSFLIEGMVDHLLSGSPESLELLQKYEFYIFPMQNVDGVIAGNYRSTPQSENLEVMWKFDEENTLNLVETTPPEVVVVQQYAKRLMSDGGPTVTIALNLHSANSSSNVRPFFFPHFGPEELGYLEQEVILWNKQLSFINTLSGYAGAQMIEPAPADGGASFATKTYPESWWWVNFQERVMAITMETTYGQVGTDSRWVKPDDLRELGKALALTIGDYNDSTAAITIPVSVGSRSQESSELYLFNAEDLSKQ